MEIGVIELFATKVEDTDWSRAREHVLQSLEFEVEIFLDRRSCAATTRRTR
jgi:hypothetical protein